VDAGQIKNTLSKSKSKLEDEPLTPVKVAPSSTLLGMSDSQRTKAIDKDIQGVSISKIPTTSTPPNKMSKYDNANGLA